MPVHPRARRPRLAVAACAALVLVRAAAGAEPGADAILAGVAREAPQLARQLEARPDLVAACLATYHHGITRELAEEHIPDDAVPLLSDLLRAPSFPRRDNLVAFLAWRGDDVAAAALADMVAAPALTAWTPEEDRALLMAPRALAHAAEAGSTVALDRLLALAGRDGASVALAMPPRIVPDAAALRRDILGVAARAAASLGAPGDPTSAGPAVDGADAAGAAESPVTDGDPRMHDTGLSHANHVDLTVDQGMSDARLDDVLALSSLRMGRADFDGDTSCCVRLRRSGNGATFGAPGDGLDVIDDSAELSTVLNDASARVKVVRAINYCGGSAMNILGCAWVRGWGVALARRSSVNVESIAWAHEYGHNIGLQHVSDQRDIMAGFTDGQNAGLGATECATYHAPPAAAGPDVIDVGACADGDLDDVHDGVDNCAQFANLTQADADGDGRGDACDCNAQDPDDPLPGVAADVRVVSDGLVTWTMPPEATTTSLLSGSVDVLRIDASTARIACLASGLSLPSYLDLRPPPAAGLYYLAECHSACGASGLGSDFAGQPRAGQACP